MISSDADLKIFLNNIIIDLDNHNLSNKQLFTLGEFFLLWKFKTNFNFKDHIKHPIKYYILGWYIYTFLLNK